MEQQLEELRAPPPETDPPAAVEPNDPEPGDEDAREQQRAADYERELERLREALSEHAGESRDEYWAKPLETSVQASLSSTFEGFAVTKNVGCRSKTCTATLTFPTPGDALESLQHPEKLAVQGCKGLMAIPVPPTSAGPYDLTLVYTCR